MRSRGCALLVAVLALNGGLATPALAAVESLLFPRLDCFDWLDGTLVTLRFGVDNLNTETVSNPSINFFSPSSVIPPISFLPGYTPRVLAVTVDTTVTTTVSWILGSIAGALNVDTTSLSDTKRCAAWVPNVPNVFPSALVYTFPHDGILTIVDPNVTPTSVIVLQYVGGERNPKAPVVLEVEAGQFTAKGARGRQFRYVVFN